MASDLAGLHADLLALRRIKKPTEADERRIDEVIHRISMAEAKAHPHEYVLVDGKPMTVALFKMLGGDLDQVPEPE